MQPRSRSVHGAHCASAVSAVARMAGELDGNLMKFLIPTWLAVLRHITTRKPFIIWRCSAQHYNSVVVYLSTASTAFAANEAVEVILVDSLGGGLDVNSKRVIKCFLYVAITFFRELLRNTTGHQGAAVTKLLEEARDKRKLRSKLKSLLLPPSHGNTRALISVEMAKLNLRIVKVFDTTAPPQENWYDCGLFMWVSAFRLYVCLSTDKCTADGVRECLTNPVKHAGKVQSAINQGKIMKTRTRWFFVLLAQWIRAYHQLGITFKERVASLQQKGVTTPTREKDIPYLCVKVCGKGKKSSEFFLKEYNEKKGKWTISDNKGDSQMIVIKFSNDKFQTGDGNTIVFSNPLVPDSMHVNKYNSIWIVDDELTQNKYVAPTPFHVACMFPRKNEHAWIRSELLAYQSFLMDDDGMKQGEACGKKYKYDLAGLAVGQEMLDSVMGFLNSACDKASRKRKRVDLTF